MVTNVKIKGLNIVRSRGKFYVYHRETGQRLLGSFNGNRVDLEKRLGEPDFIGLYNSLRKRDLKHTYPEGTLGSLVQWFENECPEYLKLAPATKKDYTAAFVYLRPEFDAPLNTITQTTLYEVRDQCAKDKWPRFSDKMISAVSSMFTQASKRGRMDGNPALGIRKCHKADPNANREWSLPEWIDAIKAAKGNREIETPLMLARYAGFRGQTIAILQWKHYQPDARFGKCFRHTARKNDEQVYVPVVPELREYLDSLDRKSFHIATHNDGTPWKDEKQMQTAISHFLRGIENSSAVESGATLHGLRVSFAAEIGRDGSGYGDVAAALGDRSERMGKHYTRHVQNESRVIRVFEKKQRK